MIQRVQELMTEDEYTFLECDDNHFKNCNEKSYHGEENIHQDQNDPWKDVETKGICFARCVVTCHLI